MVLDEHRALASESGVILGVAFAARSHQDLDDAIGLRVDPDPDIQTRMQAALDRAVARGDLAPGTADIRLLLRVIASTVLGLMFRSAPDDADFLTRFIDELLMPALVSRPSHDQEPLR